MSEIEPRPSDSGQGSDPNEESIDLIVESVLERLQRDEPVDFPEINLSHPELQPGLASRLSTLRQVFEQFRDSEPLDQSETRDTVPSPHYEPPTIRRGISESEIIFQINCPHCRVDIRVQENQDEVICGNCGSSIQLTPENRPVANHSLATRLKRLGRFSLKEVIGQGGFGIVYRAYDTKLDRVVAIKLPREGVFVDKRDEQRFLREAKHVARLNHPHIVPVYEIGYEANSPYIVSEYIDGPTLGDLIRDRRIDSMDSAELLADVADAVGYAHEQKIIHRDLKPGNILLDQNHKPFVTDFGLARSEAGEFTITMDGQVIGTPSYMSPEQVRGDSSKVGPLSDVYSLGVIFYRMLTGELPFRGNKRLMLHQIQYEDPRAPRTLNDRIPRDLETIVLKAMSKDSARRYQSARALANDLRSAVRGEPILARPDTRMEKFTRLCRRYPVASTLAAALALSLLLVAAGGLSWAVREFVLRNRVSHQKELLQEEKNQSQYQHARTLVANGNNLIRAGDNIGSLPWIAHAFRVEHDVPDRQNSHRLRLGSLLSNCPHLISVKACPHSISESMLSPDNRLAAAGFDNGRILVWDIREDRTVIDSAEFNKVSAFAFSPDNRFFAAANRQGKIHVWNTLTGDKVGASSRHTNVVTVLRFNSASTILASGSIDRTARLWSFLESVEDRVFEHEIQITDLLFNSDETAICTLELLIRDSCSLNVWDINDPKAPKVRRSFPFGIRNMNLDRERDRLVGPTWDNEMFVIQLADNSPQPSIILPVDTDPLYVNIIATQDEEHPDQVLLATTSGIVQRRSLPTGEVLSELQTGISISSFATSSDGTIVAMGDRSNQVHVWDAEQHFAVCPPLHHSNVVRYLQFTNNGRYLLTSGQDGFAKIWDLTSCHSQRVVIPGAAEPLGTISESGKRVAIVNQENTCQLDIVSTANGRVIRKIQCPEPPKLLRFSPDDSELLVTFGHDLARVVNVESGVFTNEQYVAEDSFWRVFFSVDGRRIIGVDIPSKAEDVFNQPCQTLIWNRDTGEIAGRIQHSYLLQGLHLSEDGKYLAARCYDQSAQIWKADTGEPVTEKLHDKIGYTNDCDFSFNGEMFMTAVMTVQQVFIRDISSGTPIVAPLDLFADPTRAHFFQEGSNVIVATTDGTVHHWKPGDGAEPVLRTFGTYVERMTYDDRSGMLMTSSSRPVALSADERHQNATIQIWDMTTLEMVGPLFTSVETVEKVMFDANHLSVIAVHESGTVTNQRLVQDSRSLAVVSDIAAALSGYEINRSSRPTPLTADEFNEVWQRVKNRYPETSPSRYSPE